MGRRSRSFLITLSILVVAVAITVPLSRAQVVRLSKSVLLIPQTVLSLPQRLLGLSPKVLHSALLRGPVSEAAAQQAQAVTVGEAYHFDTSLPVRDYKPVPIKEKPEHEANRNPKLPVHHTDAPDGAFVQDEHSPSVNTPTPILNFDGIPFPGVVCNCAPPDTNGEVGATQYVQIVNEGYQVFNKATGTALAPAVAISTIWTGFSGPCETAGDGDPVVLYDQLANRWLISQFADNGVTVTDECIAVSTTNDALGAYNRYGFHLSENFNDYPHLGVWPDGYYMSVNVFNSAGTAFLGLQPFAFDRTRMLAGLSATFVTTGLLPGGSSEDAYPALRPGREHPPPGRRAQLVRGVPGHGAGLQGLAHARRLRRPGQYDLHALRQPGGGRVHGAVSGYAKLRATTGEHGGAGWHRRPVHVPYGLPQLRRPRIGGEQLLGPLRRGRGDPLDRAARRDRRAGDALPGGHVPARHRLAVDGQRGAGRPGQHDARVQRFEPHDQPADPLHRAPGRRSAQHPAGRTTCSTARAASSTPSTAGAITAT